MDRRIPAAVLPEDIPTGTPTTTTGPDWWSMPAWFTPQDSTALAAALGLGVVLVALVVIRRRRNVGTTTGPSVQPPGKDSSAPKRDTLDRFLIIGMAVVGPPIMAAAFYGSFAAVEGLAQGKVNPPFIVPLVIDGILVLFILVDIYLAKKNAPSAFVKQTVRGFTAFTLVANGISGFPDPISILLHIPAALGIVVITEVARVYFLRKAQEESGEPPFDSIPFMRWVLAPWSTAVLWRWMIMQDHRNYASALRLDNIRRDAMAIMRGLSESQRRQVPGYLRRRLRLGQDIPRTVSQVRILAATVTTGGHLMPVTSSAPGDVTSARGDVPAPAVTPAPGIVTTPPPEGMTHRPAVTTATGDVTIPGTGERHPEESAPVTHPVPHPGPQVNPPTPAPEVTPAPRRTGDAPAPVPAPRPASQVNGHMTANGDQTSATVTHPVQWAEFHPEANGSASSAPAGTAGEPEVTTTPASGHPSTGDATPHNVTTPRPEVTTATGDVTTPEVTNRPEAAPEEAEAEKITPAPQNVTTPDGDDDDTDPPGGGGGAAKPRRGEKKGAIIRLLHQARGHKDRALELAKEPEFASRYGKVPTATLYKYRKTDYYPEVLSDLMRQYGDTEMVLSEIQRQGIAYDPAVVDPILTEVAKRHENVRPLRTNAK